MEHIVYNVSIFASGKMSAKEIKAACDNAIAIGEYLKGKGVGNVTLPAQTTAQTPSVARTTAAVPMGRKGEYEARMNSQGYTLRDGEYLARLARLLGIDLPATREGKAQMMIESIDSGDLVRDAYARWVFKGNVISGIGSGGMVSGNVGIVSSVNSGESLGEIDLDDVV